MPKNNRHGKAEVLTEEYREKIKQHLPTARDRLLFAIAEYTGERWGAIVQLQVRYVYADPSRSLPLEQITFPARNRKGKRDTRQVPVHPSLKELLMAHKPPASGWLFPSSQNPENHLPFSTADKMFRQTLFKAGLQDKGISLHSTRHTFVTQISQQFDIHVVQQLTGHRSLSVLAGYIKADPDLLKQAIACLP